MQSVWLVFQLLMCLALGFFAARRLPMRIEKLAFQILPYCSYLLLFVIAFEFAQIIDSITHPQLILKTALILALCTSLGTLIFCYFLFKSFGFNPIRGQVSITLFLQSLLNISYTLIVLALGYFLAVLLQHANFSFDISSWPLLLFFMFLIGLDLAYSPLDRSWMNWRILLVPLGAIIGSILGACVSLFYLPNIALKDLIMLSQGYGFYSMTSIVITELRNAELGSIALMNDLFREIFAIVLMYIIGWRYPRSVIASAGATSMDATLPMIKQACGNDFIPHAIVSGFILSLLAPILVSVLAAV
ncbi:MULTISPECIES: lysine exporter LysO family protein [unclassified Acinetobacter]|uniref:lysine exporter LysO family protein n=1 Tax=unclassified Acinetobacter TaxID=196816 RepID=UPI0029346DC9|nr:MULTISPECIES: lysine exporter LysO family protein [unclassified Acinetobacter]WOE31870.1 lysine exporter LysO family protein [Acinetobacter sp. SAAs470]WOE37337.1 lysine exporter LysO family protein [Acinetobacter sp. SAAs474]